MTPTGSWRGRLAASASARRKELAGKVSEAMQTLAMAGGRFEVALDELPDGGAHGFEQSNSWLPRIRARRCDRSRRSRRAASCRA